MLSILPRYASTAVCTSGGVPTTSTAPPARFTTIPSTQFHLQLPEHSNIDTNLKNIEYTFDRLSFVSKDCSTVNSEQRQVQEIRLCLRYARRQTALFCIGHGRPAPNGPDLALSPTLYASYCLE